MNRVKAPVKAVAVALLGLLPARALAAEEGRKLVADFELRDLRGKKIKLSALVGQVVIVDFWATWCTPCLQELPFLQDLQDQHKGDVTVLAIATDGPETLAQVRNFVKRYGWTMTVPLDPEGVAKAILDPRGIQPFTLFVDRKGRVAYQHEGYTSGDERAYAKYVAQLVAEPK